MCLLHSIDCRLTGKVIGNQIQFPFIQSSFIQLSFIVHFFFLQPLNLTKQDCFTSTYITCWATAPLPTRKMPERRAADLLISCIKDRNLGSDIDTSELLRAAGSGDEDLEAWVQENLGHDTLLTKEELALLVQWLLV